MQVLAYSAGWQWFFASSWKLLSYAKDQGSVSSQSDSWVLWSCHRQSLKCVCRLSHVQIICTNPWLWLNDWKSAAAPILGFEERQWNLPWVLVIPSHFLSEGDSKCFSTFGRNLNLNFSLSMFIFLFGLWVPCASWTRHLAVARLAHPTV